ncbi:MAG: IS701 family transposase [Anaerolineae bacterium]|nr:IS701 family transposase [Anaerolineae bacterium]
MTPEDLDEWADDFEAFHARLAHLFARRESRQQAAKYLRGLLASVERKNSWQLAEVVGDTLPDASQRLLYRVHWDEDAARDVLQQFVSETLGEDDGIGVVDETGFLKKGDKSVGVQRQYSGTAGKTENCQIGVFLSYVTSKGHAFLDRRLYLPQSWASDRARRTAAQVPEAVELATKAEQAGAMLEHAWQHGVPMGWVTGDEVYGDAPYLRDLVARHGRCYVLAVRSHTPVWLQRPTVEEPRAPTGGRPQTQPRLAEDAPHPTAVMAVVAGWPSHRWQRLTVAEGEKGPRTYDWACQRVVESRDGLPDRAGWLLARRSISDPTDIAYYLSNASTDTAVLKLAQVASARYTVEQCIEEAKGETGLDEYEVRTWQSWHRHITLSMLAHAWLASTRYRTEVKKGTPTPGWRN